MTEDRTDIDPLVLVLELARKLILEPDHWTQNTFARSHDRSLLCDPESAIAECWCAMGAIRAAVHKLDKSLEAENVSIVDAYAVVCDAFNVSHTTRYDTLDEANDAPETTHEMMITAFDHAICELG